MFHKHRQNQHGDRCRKVSTKKRHSPFKFKKQHINTQNSHDKIKKQSPLANNKLSLQQPSFSSTIFRPSQTLCEGPKDRYGDTWTRQAKAMGYLSRAVFKLFEAQKKHLIIKKGDIVVDLGCSPGSWSKLSSHLASGRGFVLGLVLTELATTEQSTMGV